MLLLLLLLLLHLLHLLQALLLHELHALLGRHRALGIFFLRLRGLGGLKYLWGLLIGLVGVGFDNGIVVRLLIRYGVHAGILTGRRRVFPCAQDDGSRCSLAFVAENQVVVTRPVEELGENIFRLSGAVVAEDALIFAEAFNLGSGLGGDLVEDLAQVRVEGLDVQSLAVPSDGRLFRGIIGGPFGWLGGLRGRGFDRGRSGDGGVTGAGAVRFGALRGGLRGGEGAGQQDSEAGNAQGFRAAGAGSVTDRFGRGVPHKHQVWIGLESPRLSMY